MTTLTKELIFEDIGLHTGTECKTVLKPFDRQGIFFKFNGKTVQATAEKVCDTSRCTMLDLNGHKIQTCEHLLASVYALGIDSVLIENFGEEIPVFDGSGICWSKVLKDHITGTPEKRYSLKNSIEVCDGDAFIKAEPSDKFEIFYTLDYSHPMIGKKEFYYTEDKFLEYVAPSRTFALYEEIEFLRANGLAKGGTEENCIVIFKDRISTDLRHEKELVTHKILDLLGDISLTGKSLDIKITANKSGHKLNNMFARELRTVITNDA